MKKHLRKKLTELVNLNLLCAFTQMPEKIAFNLLGYAGETIESFSIFLAQGNNRQLFAEINSEDSLSKESKVVAEFFLKED